MSTTSRARRRTHRVCRVVVSSAAVRAVGMRCALHRVHVVMHAEHAAFEASRATNDETCTHVRIRCLRFARRRKWPGTRGPHSASTAPPRHGQAGSSRHGDRAGASCAGHPREAPRVYETACRRQVTIAARIERCGTAAPALWRTRFNRLLMPMRNAHWPFAACSSWIPSFSSKTTTCSGRP